MSRLRPRDGTPAPTRRTTRPVSSGERELWERLVADVAPIGQKTRAAKAEPVQPSSPSPPPSSAEPARPRGVPAPKGIARSAKPAAAPGTGLDRRTRQKLQKGNFPIAARLDLHGMTQDQAHDALAGFIQRQSGQGARCVLVITGLGQRSGGVLRALTPRWLAEPPLASLVLAINPAKLAHGGDGALYVLLRRRREVGGNAR